MFLLKTTFNGVIYNIPFYTIKMCLMVLHRKIICYIGLTFVIEMTDELMKKLKIFVAVVVSLGVVWGLGMWIIFGEAALKNIKNKEPYPFYNGKYHLIAHAGGKIDGHIYTSSREAVEDAIKSGMKFIEIDFIKTSDGYYIAGHDWKLFNKAAGHPERGDKPMSLAEAKVAKIYGKYTTMDANDVAELMRQHPEWILLVDKARDIEYIAELFPFPKRVILQVYGLYGYLRALNAGIDYPTLRLKGGRRGVKEIYKVFMDWLNVKSVILGEKSFEKNLDYIGELHDKGTTVILYGNPRFKIVENASEIKKYINKYIDLVDTDTVREL